MKRLKAVMLVLIANDAPLGSEWKDHPLKGASPRMRGTVTMKAAFVIMSTAATSPANPPQRESAELYYDDPFSWSVEQSDALRRRDFDAVDWDHVIEEIKDVGERHHDSWVSQCSRAIRHLLKIEHHREASLSTLESWEDEVQDARDEMLTIVEKHPGLKHRLSCMFAAAWNPARRKACREQDCSRQTPCRQAP